MLMTSSRTHVVNDVTKASCTVRVKLATNEQLTMSVLGSVVANDDVVTELALT